MPSSDRQRTKDDIAEALDVHVNTVLKWVKEGCPHSGTGGNGHPYRFDETEVAAWLRSQGKTALPGRPRDESTGSQDEADLRKTNAMADNWELRNARELGELIPATDILRVWSRMALSLRARLMLVAPAVAPRLDGMSVGERIAEIEQHIREALEGFDPDVEPTTSGETAGSGETVLPTAEAAGEDQAQPVGGEVSGIAGGPVEGAGAVAE